MRRVRRNLLLLGCCAIASCGGGGGGGFVAEPTAVIDSSNAQAIAGAAVAGNLALVNAVGSTGIGVALGTNGGGVRGAVSRLLSGTSARPSAHSMSQGAARVQPQTAFGPETQDCTVSGSIRISGNLADPNTVSPGDSLIVTLTDCDDGDGFVLDGTMTLRVTNFSGDAMSGAFLLVADTTFTNLTVVSDTESGTLNGMASLTFDSTDVSEEITRLVADSLRFTSGGEVFQLNDYDVTGVTLFDTNQYTLDVSGFLQDSAAFTGMVRLDTVTAFSGAAGDFPSAGYLIITGADASEVDVESLDPVQARLHLDADGDGVAEEVIDVDWTVLAGP